MKIDEILGRLEARLIAELLGVKTPSSPREGYELRGGAERGAPTSAGREDFPGEEVAEVAQTVTQKP